MPNVKVAPSLLAADPMNFEKELRSVEAAGADFHHVDVMDGHFVPNLTYGLPFVKALKKASKIPLDVHIMVSNPDQVAMDYVKAGADILAFPIESVTHVHRLLTAIQEAGAKAGVAINPGTPLETLWPILEYVDLINIMSVNPGFGGQSFIRNAIARVGEVDKRLCAIGRRDVVLLEVDGGINAETGQEVVDQGADLLVAGSYIFESTERDRRISSLKTLSSKG